MRGALAEFGGQLRVPRLVRGDGGQQLDRSGHRAGALRENVAEARDLSRMDLPLPARDGREAHDALPRIVFLSFTMPRRTYRFTRHAIARNDGCDGLGCRPVPTFLGVEVFWPCAALGSTSAAAMPIRSSSGWASALVLLSISCSGSTHTAAPTPAAEPTVSTVAGEADAGAPVAADVPVATVVVTEDAGAPVAEAPMPPMPTGLHGPARPWARMTARERDHYMGEAVLPAMTALLQAYDPVHYARVTCATCHGSNARAVHFHMPNTLEALPMFGTPASQQLMAAEHRMFEFMGTRMVPAMAQLLGKQPFNPATHQGFGCFDCHPHEGAATH